ncbi:MAG: hypothetical protein ACYDAB_12815 [bacterium]
MVARFGAPRFISALCSLCVCLVLLGAARAEAEQIVRPFTSLDLRYSPGETYINFSQVRDKWIFPNISYQQVAIFNNLSEVSVGGGYQFIQQPGFVLAVTLNVAENSLGTQWVEPGLGLYWNMDRLTVSASGGYAVYLNSSASPVLGIDPIEVTYQLDNRWSVGVNATSFVVGQPVTLDILPFVRYDTGHGFYELGVDNLGPRFTQEIQLRWAAFL